MISDRATAFTSKNFENFVKENEIAHNLTAVAFPWANGQVDRVNKFLKSTLAKICEEPFNWKANLGKAQFVLNNTLHKSINTTPSKLLLDYEQKYKNDKELCKLIEELTAINCTIEQERRQIRDAAQLERIELCKNIIKLNTTSIIRNL